MNQCQQCRKERRSWKDCPAVPKWFGPADICYCPHQVEWILSNLATLKSGYWPPEHVETGYYDTGGRKVRRGGAYFEVPIIVAADVETRLDMCGPDGVLAKQCLGNGWDEGTLADIMNKPLHVIQAKIRRVVNYCSGARTRQITYYEFTRRRGIARAQRGN
uniref:Uncharacterized protein n=1 Tax=viral metagenome TaxID=1070528 RepID=A0A6H1ZTD9_9ZZZZ